MFGLRSYIRVYCMQIIKIKSQKKNIVTIDCKLSFLTLKIISCIFNWDLIISLGPILVKKIYRRLRIGRNGHLD